jgi:hypothetical protein
MHFKFVIRNLLPATDEINFSLFYVISQVGDSDLRIYLFAMQDKFVSHIFMERLTKSLSTRPGDFATR